MSPPQCLLIKHINTLYINDLPEQFLKEVINLRKSHKFQVEPFSLHAVKVGCEKRSLLIGINGSRSSQFPFRMGGFIVGFDGHVWPKDGIGSLTAESIWALDVKSHEIVTSGNQDM